MQSTIKLQKNKNFKKNLKQVILVTFNIKIVNLTLKTIISIHKYFIDLQNFAAQKILTGLWNQIHKII